MLGPHQGGCGVAVGVPQHPWVLHFGWMPPIFGGKRAGVLLPPPPGRAGLVAPKKGTQWVPSLTHPLPRQGQKSLRLVYPNPDANPKPNLSTNPNLEPELDPHPNPSPDPNPKPEPNADPDPNPEPEPDPNPHPAPALTLILTWP